MEVIVAKTDIWVLRLETGEELITELQQFVRKRRIGGAWFLAIGAVDDVEIAFYDLKKGKYVHRRFRSRMEILNVTGNIALRRRSGQAKKEGDIVVHAHGIFGKPNYQTVGGHIVRCRISATCEIYFKKLPPLRRKPDGKSGLYILKP